MQSNSSPLNLFHRLPQNLGKIFWGKNLLWHVIAIELTYVAVATDFDWTYLQATENPNWRPFLMPAATLGFFLPFFVPVAILLWGILKKSARTLNTAFAVTQAGVVGWLLSAVYKSITGRPGPDHFSNLGDISRVFHFGFFSNKVFYGWPSSHNTVTFAMCAALFVLYPDSKPIRWLTAAYAAYIGIAVSMTIHWFSDALAGIIFGTLVGAVIGNSFLKKYRESSAA